MIMNGEIWERDNYIAKVPYIINQYITEYDMKRANISVLYNKGVISKALYDYLYDADRSYREKYIGQMQRYNPLLSEIKSNAIREFRGRFYEANSLSQADILSIKSDAIFVLGRQCQCTKFENIEFRVANIYNAYMHIGNLEIYYGFDPMTGDQNIDVKGIKDDKLELHRDHMMMFLCNMFYELLTSGPQEAIKCSQEFLEVLLSKSSPDPGFYRIFDSNSGYLIRTHNSAFIVPSITPAQISFVDTSANVNFLSELLSILSDIYLRNIK